MKKLLVLLGSFLLVVAVYADPNEKVLRSFHETFASAENVKWEEFSGHYRVSFLSSGMRSKVDYDKEGNILGSIRYYDPSLLPLNILTTLRKEQSKTKLFGVTEVTVGEEVVYFVKMETEKHWITLRVDSNGNSEVFEKYRKA